MAHKTPEPTATSAAYEILKRNLDSAVKDRDDARLERDYYAEILTRHREEIKPLMKCLQWDLLNEPIDDNRQISSSVDKQADRARLFCILDMFNLQVQTLPTADNLRRAKQLPRVIPDIDA